MNFNKCIFLTVLFCFFSRLYPQITSNLPASKSPANASVAVQNEWNAFQNVSALAHVKNAEVAIQYENRFIIKELSTKSIQLAKNLKSVNVGASFSYFGYALYNDMILGMGIAKNFNDKFSMGLQFNYYSVYFSGRDMNHYKSSIFPQFGISAHLSAKLIVGFNTFNPFQSNITSDITTKKIPSIYSLGTNYAFVENVFWLTQIDKEVNTKLRLATGLEYTMTNEFSLKMGVYSQDYIVPSIGINVNFNKLGVSLNTDLHPIMGLSPLISLKYKY